MNKSRVLKTQPLGEKAFLQHTGWNSSGDYVWANSYFPPHLKVLKNGNGERVD